MREGVIVEKFLSPLEEVNYLVNNAKAALDE